jgi:ribose 1,5-bisphosphokinase
MSGAQERKSPELTALDALPPGNVASGSSEIRAENQVGTLILVVGPSGSGKDTLLAAARRHFSGTDSVIFCERIITRSGDIGEKHVCVSETEFERMAASGGFFLFWDAHGLSYGIPAEMLTALEAGKTVVANVSRRIIAEAQGKWPHTLIVNVTASRDVLRERLLARGRESAEIVEKRLERAFSAEVPDNGCVEEIDNSGALQPAAERMIAIIGSALNIR